MRPANLSTLSFPAASAIVALCTPALVGLIAGCANQKAIKQHAPVSFAHLSCAELKKETNRALRDFNRNEYLLENDTPQMARQRLNALRNARLEKRC